MKKNIIQILVEKYMLTGELLYHNTFGNHLWEILKQNHIEGRTLQNVTTPPKTKYLKNTGDDNYSVMGISMTRNKLFTFKRQSCLIFDKNKLKQHYKIFPLNFFSKYGESKNSKKYEFEEFVICKEIKPLSKYLYGIKFNMDINMNIFDERFIKQLPDILKKYPNIKIFDKNEKDITIEFEDIIKNKLDTWWDL